ncbi:trigger factor [Haploplasma axanthum]|uniref:Trigger factor n=1 Tax=Haploplasma axanthum TaxID=29552 RepID=A0A449BE81_HAPAX|nr:trigger factor [Haploplasma axanthum]VEU80737.1 Trigger factor [Haploplasma axanthum]
MKIEKLSPNRVKFTFDVTVDDFNHALDHAFEHVKNDVEIKGFRKGHVTRSVYESKFGVESLFEEALNHVFHHKFHDALANEEYQLVGDPKPIVDFEKVAVGKEFEVAFEIAIKPEVELPEYKGIEVEKFDNTVTDEEVNERLNKLAESETVLEPKAEGSLENGETAVFDFEGFADGVPFEGGKAENHELEIGSGQFIPGFEEQMIGMNVGEEKDVNVTFPEQYHAENLAGKPAVFKVKLHEIKKKVSPELNDEWVKALGRSEQTLTELKEALKKEVETEKSTNNKNVALDKALKVIAEATKVDIPVEMIDYEVNQALKNIENQAKQYGLDLQTYISLTGMQEDELKNRLKEEGELRILNSLIIEAVAKKEKFEVSEKEVVEKYDELSKHYNMPVDEIKKHLPENLVKTDIEFAKAVNFIFDNLKFV